MPKIEGWRSICQTPKDWGLMVLISLNIKKKKKNEKNPIGVRDLKR